MVSSPEETYSLGLLDLIGGHQFDRLEQVLQLVFNHGQHLKGADIGVVIVEALAIRFLDTAVEFIQKFILRFRISKTR